VATSAVVAGTRRRRLDLSSRRTQDDHAVAVAVASEEVRRSLVRVAEHLDVLWD
jgi:hypothetical protein